MVKQEYTTEWVLRAQKIAHLGIWDQDPISNELWWSDETFRILGIEPQTIAPSFEKFLQMVHPDDRAFIVKQTELLKSDDIPYKVDYRIIRGDKSERIVHEEALIERDEKGTPIKITGILQDVTERKRAEKELAAQRQRLGDILTGTNAGTWNWNVQTGEVTMNERWAEIMGHTLKELVPIDIQTWINSVHPEDLANVNNQLERHFAGQQDYYDVEFRQPHKDGGWVWVNARGKVVEWTSDGKPLRMSGTHLDITERKQTEEALQESEERYMMATRAARVGVWDWNVQTGEFYLGPNVKALLGYSDEEISNDLDIWTGYVHPDDRQAVMDAFQAHLDGQTPEYVYEHRMWHKDGSARWILVRGTAIRDAQGNAVRVMGTDTDITERKRVEEERERLLVAEREQRLLAETLAEVTLALTSQTQHDAVLDEILRQAQRIVPFTTANIVLLEGDVFRSIHGLGYKAWGTTSFLSDTVHSLKDFPTDAEVVRSQKPVVIPKTYNDARWVAVDETAWIQSYLAVPICLRDHVVGLLRLDSDTPDAFSTADVERLLPLVNAAAIAIENAWLYEQAQQDTETKTLLLREVNHRVLNNLTMIMSILDIEQRRPLDDEVDFRAVLHDVADRIGGMVTVHRMLSSAQWMPLDLREVVTRVIDAALSGSPIRDRIAVEVGTPNDALRVSSKQAITVALMINELTTNSIKYAFGDGSQGRIHVQITALEREGNEREKVCLVYRDDGPGMPEEVLAGERQGTGLWLVEVNVQGLRGEVKLQNDGGAVAVLTFERAPLD
ncbi:MAG: PAS domain-containing protein [Chloroflexi bacterium]|nr:PAS domain-containing protein [Chloroflexota bacterium]